MSRLLAIAVALSLNAPQTALAQQAGNLPPAMVFAKDGVPLTTPYRIRSGSTGKYLYADGRKVAVGDLVDNDDRFIWVLENIDERGVTRVDRSQNLKIINLKYSYSLTSNPKSGAVSVIPSIIGPSFKWFMTEKPRTSTGWREIFDYDNKLHKTSKWGSKLYEKIWNPITNEPIGKVEFRNDKGALQVIGNDIFSNSPGGFTDDSQSWYIEEAPKRDLAKLVWDSVTADKTSTGQDENTRALFDAIEFALEYGPSIYSLGASNVITTGLKHAAGAAIKKGAAAGVKKASKKLAANSAKRSMSEFAKAGMREAEKRAIELATKKAAWSAWAKQGKTYASVLTKDAAKKAARSARKTAIKNGYSSAAKFLGVKGGTRVVGREMLTATGNAAADSVRNHAINKLVEANANASGRDSDNEGIVETVFSQFGIDDTPDDLMMSVNGLKMWPNGGSGHRSIKSGETLDVKYEFIFDRQKGLNIHLTEWDSHSSDDDLGTMALSTANLKKVEVYDRAFIKHDKEGSLYSLNFAIAPLYIPTPYEIDVQIRTEMEVDEEIRFGRATEHFNDLESARKKYRAEILDKFGEDVDVAFDNAQAWDNKYRSACDRPNNAAAGYISMMLGEWRVGLYDERGEKNYDQTWTYRFNHDGSFRTPHAVGRWNRLGFVRGNREARARGFGTGGQYANCGIYIQIDDRNDKLERHPEKRDAISRYPREEFIPVFSFGGETHAARRHPEIRWSELAQAIKLSYDAIYAQEGSRSYGMEYGVETKLNRPQPGGLALWMEKIEDPQAKSPETSVGSEKAKKDIIGTWEMGEYGNSTKRIRPPMAIDSSGIWNGIENAFDKRSRDAKIWTFTSDNLFIGHHESLIGTWQYIGDRRILVKTANGLWGNSRYLDKEFIVYLDLDRHNLEFNIMKSKRGSRWPMAGITDFLGVKFKETVNRPIMAEGTPEALTKLRQEKGLPLPEEEKVDVELYKTVKKDREERLAKLLEYRRNVKEATENHAVLEELEKSGQCYFDEELEDNQIFLGDWQITRHTSSGSEMDTASGSANWLFGADGGLTGNIDGKPWRAEWTASPNCEANITFDPETAAFYNVGTRANIRLNYYRNGDKKILILNQNEFYHEGRGALRVSGSQEVDKSIYSYNYGYRDYTRAQLANRCVAVDNGTAQVSSLTGAGNDNLILEGTTNYSTVDLFKVNRSGTSAQPVGQFTEFGGHKKPVKMRLKKGDELAFLDADGNCAGVLSTNHVSRLQPLSQRTRSFPFGASGLVSTVLQVEENLTSAQIENGCSAHQRVTSLLNKDDPEIERKLYNTGSDDFHIYQAEAEGAYVNPKPIFTVKPGGFAKLNDFHGRKYTLLDNAEQCVAIVELDHMGEHGILIGDGSTNIKDPEYVSPAQIANGCLKHNDVRSINNPFSDTARVKGSALVANSGQSDMRVYWVDYDGHYDLKRPVVTIKSGEIAEIFDFATSQYEVLNDNNKCEAIIQPEYVSSKDGANAPLHKLGDDSSTVTGDVIGLLAGANVTPPANLSKHQIANGCSLYGKIASKPSADAAWARNIINAGSKPLTVRWISFYGQSVDSEFSRKPETDITIAPGETRTIGEDSTQGDVFVVLEDGEQCVAVVQSSNKYIEDWGVPNLIKKNASDDVRTNYVLRDKKSAEEFDIRVAEWIKDAERQKAKLAELDGLWAKGNCKPQYSPPYAELRGKWEVGIYDRGGRQKQIGENPTIWNFKSLFRVAGTYADGRAFSSQAAPEHCIFKPGGSTGDEFKLISHSDGSKEFFSVKKQNPDILYSDGSVHTLITSSEDIEPRLAYWGKKSPPVGPITDADSRDNEVDENSPVGALVGITASAGNTDAVKTVTYSLLNDADGLFKIDASTGVVSVASLLDAETATSQTIYVGAVDSDGSTNRQKYVIRINDVNERTISEIVDNDISVNEVDENSRVGTRVGIIAFANDNDVFDSVRYSLADNAGGLFNIDPDSGEVFIVGLIDAERADNYKVQITATSSDGSKATKVATIQINDINEFNLGEISDRNNSPNVIAETAQIGSAVGITAFAQDADRSAGQVTYSIVDNRGEPFAIDPITGVITLTGPLSASSVDQYDIDVRASSTDKTSSARVFSLEVTHVNKFGISKIFDGDVGENAVHENSSIGTPVGIVVQAEDADSSDVVRYSLISGSHMFSIDPDTGVVSVAGRLDAETSERERIEVMASSSDGSVDRQSMDVNIVDVNEFRVGALTDNDPRTNSLDEDSVVETRVGITGFAQDDDRSDRTSYSLTDDAGGLFKINANSGEVVLAGLLDAETSSSHVIEITAASSDGSSVWGSFEIAVGDVNEFMLDGSGIGNGPFDDPSIVDRDPRNEIIDENSQIGTEVGISAFIEDNDRSDGVGYSLTDNADGAFAIDPESGVVTVAGRLDAETDDNPSIRIVATSSDGSRTNDQRAFNIIVNDVNEFSVSDVQDGDANLNEVTENASVGTTVGITAIASDRDIHTSRVFYDVVDASGEHLSRDQVFNVGRDTGIVTVADGSRLDFESTPNLIVHILAQSEDGSSSQQSFIVDLIDVYEEPLQEDTQTGTENPVVVDNIGEQPDQQNPAYGAGSCKADRTVIISEYTERSAKVNITNSGPTNLNVYWINYNGDDANYTDEPSPLAVVPPGQSVDIDAFRGFGFTVKDDRGHCVDIVRALEGRNSFTLSGNSAVREDIDEPSHDEISIISGGNCDLDRNALVSQYTDISATVSITNNGQSDLKAYWINYNGDDVNYADEFSPQAVVSPGQTVDINAYRGFGYTVQNIEGTCLGIVQARETRNSFSFTPKELVDPRCFVDGCGEPMTVEESVPEVSNATCELRGQIFSTTDAEPINATASIYNFGTGNLHIMWANYDGGEGDYQNTQNPVAIIAPGQSQDIAAFVGDKFVALDDYGQCIGVANVNDAVSEFSYDPIGASDNDEDEGEFTDNPQDPRYIPEANDAGPYGALTSCNLRGQIVSTSQNETASVSLTNNGSSYLHVYWIGYDGTEGDYHGAPQPVASIDPGQAHTIQAFIGFAFSVVDQDLSCYGIVQITEPNSSFIIQ
ncbi:MAG: cadherin domain-containing protein [Hyphomicrobiales bacterium]